jgi:hypothetical protein
MARGTRKPKRTGDRAIALSIIAVGETPPTEFRIFAAGENTTSKGVYLFDAAAARDVIADYEKHGIDLMIDLEHLSVADPNRSLNFDPDARGWCRLELRAGELWAVDVKWTADGAARLTEKRQRYMSPVFGYDTKTRRITDVLNIAITALPATDNLEPLVAASRRAELSIGDGETMTPEQLMALAEALGLGPDASVEDVIATVAAMVKKVTDAANGTTEEPPKDAPPPAEGDMPLPLAAASRLCAASRLLAKLSGKKEIGEVVSEVEAWRESHLKLEDAQTKLTKDRVTLEGSERRKLVGELVKLGSETPATAWSDDDAKTPVERLAREPLAELRARVEKLARAKGKQKDPAPPAGGGVDAHGLTAEQLKICADTGCKPEDFAQLRKSNPPINIRS